MDTKFDQIRKEATEVRDTALTWLNDHPHFHSARKGDVKALIHAVESLLATLPRDQDIEWAVAYPVPWGVATHPYPSEKIAREIASRDSKSRVAYHVRESPVWFFPDPEGAEDHG